MSEAAPRDPSLPDGRTALYGIVGFPIAHVASPGVLTARFRSAGENAVLLPVEIAPDEFERVMPALMAIRNAGGFVITLPYKLRIMPFLDRINPAARRIGAVNAIRRDADGRWTGDMFDGRGLIRALRKRGIDPAGRRVMLLGAGGAGSAIADALADGAAAALTIFDIDRARAETLAGSLRTNHPATAIRVEQPGIAGHDILLNASPVGLEAADGMPFDLPRLDPSLVVVDIVIGHGGTALQRHARAAGCRVIEGAEMVEGQADELVSFFQP